MGRGTDPLAPGAPTAEEYRAAAILALGLLLKVGLVATLGGLAGWAVRATWHRLRWGGRR